MHTSIEFPNIGIHLENVGKTVTVFGFDIAYYGIVIGIGMLAGIGMAMMEAKRTGQNQEDYLDLAIFAIIFGIIGARIYYVVFAWDMYKDNLLEIFNTRHGGLAIYGGVIAAVITVFVVAKVKKLPVARLLDTAVLGLVTGQMIGRWGNFFNREAFGDYTNGILAMRLPLDAVRSSDVTEKIREHIDVVEVDKMFVDVSRQFFPEVACALEQPRLTCAGSACVCVGGNRECLCLTCHGLREISRMPAAPGSGTPPCRCLFPVGRAVMRGRRKW